VVGRTVPSLLGYPVKIYVSNSTATYQFVPETLNLALWKQGDYRGLGGGYGPNAPIQLYIIRDTNISGDMLWGNAEAGCAIQNIYLMANALNLGTVCQYIRTNVAEGLGLPVNEKPLYKMPLGYLISPYVNYENLVPTSRPSSPELPMTQDSNVSLEDALNAVASSHRWSDAPVTKQELSQILWAGYGYSYYEDTATSPSRRHRTVPSAHAYYPMKVYAANASGVYEYHPLEHTLTTIVSGDRRSSIAQASGNTWASSAPLIIAVAYLVDERPWIGSEETYVEAGLMAQNIYLESAALGLIVDWRKANTNEAAVKDALGLSGQTQLHPTSIITVGHPSSTPTLLQGNWYVNDVLITDETQVFNSQSTTVSFKFVKTAGGADTDVSATVRKDTQKLATLQLTAAGTWTGTYTFPTQGRHTLTLQATDGTSTVSMSTFTIDIGEPPITRDWLMENLFIIAGGAILLTVAVYLVVSRHRQKEI
jgi:SagB-type dehydrogenase family enzyme